MIPTPPLLAAATLAAAVLAAGPAGAAVPLWRVDPQASTIAFDYAVNGQPGSGRFTQMEGEGRFDASDPAASRFELRIPARGLDLGNPLFEAFALSADWFDAATHPEIVYRLARLSPLPDGRWQALGDVTVKGRLVIQRAPITLEIGPDRARARGALVFDPSAVGLGVGPSALFATLGPEVTVAFDLVATPALQGDAP